MISLVTLVSCHKMDNHGLLGAALYLQFLFTTLALYIVPGRRIVIKDWYTMTSIALYMTLYLLHFVFCTALVGSGSCSGIAVTGIVLYNSCVKVSCSHNPVSI